MKKISLLSLLFCLGFLMASAQNNKQQKGLLWQITGNGLKKPSYLYGTMHVSQKLAFHLGDSFYLALSKSDVVALEQNLDSVIHQWITDNDFDKPEDANKVYQRGSQEYLTLSDFKLNSYNKRLLKSKLSEEAREVNYLLTRGDQGDFEENVWLDLYIYQIAKKLGKGFTGVEGFEESRDLVKKAQKEPKDAKKKTVNFSKSYKLRQQVADAYRKGDIYMIDSIDRMTESDHYREYMLYKRNANMARRMDSIMHLGKTMFTGVGCAHLPGDKGVIQMLIDKGYQLRPVQSLALEKSPMAKKYEDMTLKHKYQAQTSADGLITAVLPSKLSMVNNNSDYTSYFSPDLANGYYYQIEKIACNTIFSGKTPDDILLDIDTMIFENIPGEITSKRPIYSNGFSGMEVITQLKTGDLNRFQIIASPFNVYIIRLSGKDKFAIGSDANKFFKTLQINEGNARVWKRTQSYDSIFSVELPTSTPDLPLKASFLSAANYEHIVYDKSSGNTYMIKQLDVLNEDYIEHDSFELHVMARSFAATDNYEIVDTKTFNWQGYAAMDAQYTNASMDPIYARMVVCGTRYILFVCKPMINNYLEGLPRGNNNDQGFNDRFFSSIQFNGQPQFTYFDYKDTNFYFSVKTSSNPVLCKESNYDYSMWGEYEETDEKEAKEQDQYQGRYKEMYFKNQNANDFITVGCYTYGRYENQVKNPKTYMETWKKKGSLKCLSAQTYKRNGVDYYLYSYSDTNTSRVVKELSALRGNRRYSVVAYLDTVSGKSEFASTFFNSFDVSDTLINDSIFKPKGYRFIADFSSKDSIRRKAAIKYVYTVNFTKNDLPHLYNMIDTISNKGDAAEIRSTLIEKMVQIDSAQDLIVPYLSKLYKRFNDTAYLQIQVLTAMAKVKSLKSYQNMKPILSQDMPISDNSNSMEAILYPFYDSLKLSKNLLNELIELTAIDEYRITAYDLISRMKDSGIITENDYLPLHDKLIKETKIEYKRMMASLTNLKSKNNYNSYDFYAIDAESIQDWGEYDYSSSSSYSYRPVLNSLLDLTLPLRSKNASMGEIASKLCKINDNELRLSLMPVLLKYKLSFHDTVYEALAKNNKTRSRLYDILEDGKQLEKFPKAYLKQSEMVIAAFYNYKSYSKIDTVEILYTQKIIIGNDSGLVYVCRYKLEDDATYSLYMSESMPCDTNKLNTDKTPRVFYMTTNSLDEEDDFDQMVKKNLFENLLSLTRYRNGGYYTPEYDYGDDYGFYY
jgi:uncharacterized protein YbaP (TraB family)